MALDLLIRLLTTGADAAKSDFSSGNFKQGALAYRN